MAGTASAHEGDQLGVNGNDPFALLGLERRFDLTPQSVQRAYLQRVARLHPDMSGANEAGEQAAIASQLHEAKALLEHHESRANVLLALLGGSTKDQDKSLPEAFLMEIMEVREQAEAAVASGDALAREQWRSWAMQQRAAYVLKLTPSFAALTSDTPGTASHATLAKQTRRELNAWRYVERLIEQLDPTYDPSRADFSRPEGSGLSTGEANPR